MGWASEMRVPLLRRRQCGHTDTGTGYVDQATGIIAERVKPDSSVVREAQDWLCDRKLWISQIFSGEPGMYILRRDTRS